MKPYIPLLAAALAFAQPPLQTDMPIDARTRSNG
jgi:hypothetical protein